MIAWQRARSLTKVVYEVTASGPFARDLGLRDQIRRAAVSVMSNLAEGFERGGRTEFHQFLSMSKAVRARTRRHVSMGIPVGPSEVGHHHVHGPPHLQRGRATGDAARLRATDRSRGRQIPRISGWDAHRLGGPDSRHGVRARP
ncbi:MAG: four helix bundle protein [Nitrospirae bacterium]|nr:MAG: four helix bundle protein [Nitrospirota bacterium]